MSIVNLPAELRNRLYAELLRGSGSSVGNNHPCALFSVSKQLHNETASYWYQHNVIAIDAFSEPSAAATLLPPLPDQYLRYIRRLYVYVFTGQANTQVVKNASRLIATLATIDVQLDEVTFVIFAKMSDLLTSRVDDSVLDTNHPITSALRQLLKSNVAKKVHIELHKAWFASGIAHSLVHRFGSKLDFVDRNGQAVELTTVEKPLTGRYSSTHLTALDLDDGDTTASLTAFSTSNESSTMSLPASLCTPFSDLDGFSVTTFDSDQDQEMQDLSFRPPTDSQDASEPFFSQDDIEEWQSSTQDFDYIDPTDSVEMEELGDADDGSQEDMEDVPQEDIDAIMDNMEQAAQHKANEGDVSYMTNYAPDLLLARHQLEYLI